MSKKPIRRSNSLPDEPVRKVTIQQMVVSPPSASVAKANHSESIRRYSNVEYHDPSGRGHRGKHWAKPSRGVVANIVNNLETGKRKQQDDNIERRVSSSSGKSKVTRFTLKAEERQSDITIDSGESFELMEENALTDTLPRTEERTAEALPRTDNQITETLPRNEERTVELRKRETASTVRVDQTNDKIQKAESKEKTGGNKSSYVAPESGKRLPPIIAPKPKKLKSKEKLETSMKEQLQIPTKNEKRTLEGSVKKISEDSPWNEERKLWEKAVKEFEVVISDKEMVIERLSKVNRKLSKDIECYEKSLGDTKDPLRIGEEHRMTGDLEKYRGMIEERDRKILELESKLYELNLGKEGIRRTSLELSHGSQNVLKMLELKKEKAELERKVEELEKRLQSYESISQEKSNVFEDHKIFHEIPSLLYKFQDGIDAKQQQNLDIISNLEEKVIKCVQNCNTLTKLNKNKKKVVIEDELLKECSQQVQSVPDFEEQNYQILPGDTLLQQQKTDINNLDILNTGDFTPGDSVLGDFPPRNLTTEESNTSKSFPDENLETLQAELQKERMINENIMERFLQLEEINKDYLDSIKDLESQAKDAEKFRNENEELLVKILELQCPNTSDRGDIDGSFMKHGDILGYKDQVRSLQSTIESQKNEINELREKIAEDEELIEEIRANCQREEKWNREMQRSYEWELSSSASKDDQIEEFQDCLWAREKLLKELQEQLEFEDKRCEELLEKLIVSQKEAEDFQEMAKDFRKKLEDRERQIKEFCDQNDRDAVIISNLTSENKQLRLDVDNVTKMRRNLEEDLERVSGCLEAVEADKENFLISQEIEVQKLSGQLENEEYTSKGKDEVIEQLQRNVVLLSADVQEMEFKMEERKATLEEDLDKAREDIARRDESLNEALEKYNELQEVCKCLRETISEKEGAVLDREAVMAHQRGVIEGHEKEIEGLRRICGDSSTTLNDKPKLVYTESEMEEVTDLLEQEQTLSEIMRKQICFLEKELEDVRSSFKVTTSALEEENKTLSEARNEARNEIKEHESRLEKTEEDLGNTHKELSRMRDELASIERELEDYKTNTTILHVDLTELNTKTDLLEAIKENAENELIHAKKELEKLQMEIEILKLENKSGQDFETGQVETASHVETSWNELKNEKYVLESELKGLQEENKRATNENNEFKNVMKELQNWNENVCCENTALEKKVEKITDKWLKSEEKLRQSEATNTNLRYALEEYVSSSQDQIRHLKNHEREVATLTKHIHEMDVLIQGFKTSLQEVVQNEKKNREKAEKNKTLQDNKIPKPPSKETDSEINHRKTTATIDTPKETVSFQNSHDFADETDSKETTIHNIEPKDGKSSMASRNQSAFQFMKRYYEKIQGAKIPKNVILILAFLILVFCLGCTNNSIVSRKYLFVFANSFITLIFFALWVNETHQNRKVKMHSTFSNKESDHYAKIKSSFQQLHEEFLEAVGKSAKDTIPIQELYEKYEKLKENVEIMRKERLERDMMLTSCLQTDTVSTNDSIFPPKWNRAATVLIKTLVITLLCEVFYIRGFSFLPYAANLISFLMCLMALSYFYETTRVDDTTRVEPCATEREMKLEEEINELNVIIEKEHNIVTAQREAIKALEKRLRKEFDKRIKQRNILLKKLKYKGRLEDLRELLDNGDNDEHKAARKNEEGSVHDSDKTPVREYDGNGDKKCDKRIDMDIKCNNQYVVKKTTRQYRDDNGNHEIQEGIYTDSMDNHWRTEEYMEVNEKDRDVHQKIEQSTSSRKLQEIITKAEEQALHFEFLFSPMFFFLGLPLTAILLTCRYITLPVLMMAIQTAIFLKETKFIDVKSLPKVLQKEMNPIVMDTVLVFYACALAVSLQCTQSIVVMLTCAIVQLAVHWWTSYKLAKREDTLQEITVCCLPTHTARN